MAEDAISVIVAVAKWLTETETAPLQQHYFSVKHAKEKNEMSEVLFTLCQPRTALNNPLGNAFPVSLLEQ
jgi:hypothetical protein